jgi:hypothetical protein
LVQTLTKQWWLLQVLLDGNFIHATLGAKCVLFLQLLALRMHQLLQPVNSCGTWFSVCGIRCHIHKHLPTLYSSHAAAWLQCADVSLCLLLSAASHS